MSEWLIGIVILLALVWSHRYAWCKGFDQGFDSHDRDDEPEDPDRE